MQFTKSLIDKEQKYIDQDHIVQIFKPKAITTSDYSCHPLSEGCCLTDKGTEEVKIRKLLSKIAN